MASKKTPAPQDEEQLLEQQAEEAQPEMNGTAEMQAEIEKLRAQIAAMQKRPAQNDAELVKAASLEAAKNGVDPWSITVNVRSPRRPGKEDPWYWLNVNGLSVQVPADDRRYDLKLPWAECLMNSLDAENRAADYQDSLEVYDPITNPKRD